MNFVPYWDGNLKEKPAGFVHSLDVGYGTNRGFKDAPQFLSLKNWKDRVVIK